MIGRIPILPIMSYVPTLCRRGEDPPCVLGAGNALAVDSGSAAISMAVWHARIEPGEIVLLPAFHCRSMADAVSAVGATPAYYRIRPDLSVDMDDLVGKCSARVRAILVAHFFGIPQPEIATIRAHCDSRGMVLIEDCAHAFFGSIGSRPLGTFGDYAIASVRKFFPVADGGLLVSAGRDLSRIDLSGVNIRDEAKAIVDMLEEAAGFGRPVLLHWLLKAAFMVKRAARAFTTANARPDLASPEAQGVRPVSAPARKMTTVSQTVMRRSCLAQCATRRRANYRRLADAFSALTFAKPLYRSLPDGVVPYMFPLRITESPDSRFRALRDRGVPTYRWEEMPEGLCPVTDDYRWSLVQLPCHQSLRDSEVAWLAATVRQVLRA